MLRVLICSPDTTFADRLGAAFTRDDVVSTTDRLDARLASTLRRAFDYLIVDVRDVEVDSVGHELVALRASVQVAERCVAVTSLASSGGVTVVTRSGAQDLDVILLDSDRLTHVIRAFIWDDSRTAAAAAVLRAACGGEFRLYAQRLFVDVLTSGCRVSNVAQAAHAQGISPDTLENRLLDERSPQPKLVIRLARGLYGAVLLWRYRAKWKDLAKWTRYGKPETLRSHMRECFGADAIGLRRDNAAAPIELILSGLILGWLERQPVPKPRPRSSKQASKQAGALGEPQH